MDVTPPVVYWAASLVEFPEFPTMGLLRVDADGRVFHLRDGMWHRVPALPLDARRAAWMDPRAAPGRQDREHLHRADPDL